MKKFILSLFLLTVFSGICFSQSKKFEGYDNMAWGTTLEEFKNKNPSAYDQTSEDNRTRNEKLFYKDGVLPKVNLDFFIKANKVV